MERHLLLHLHGTAHRSVDAVEHDQQRVAAGLTILPPCSSIAGSIRSSRSLRSRSSVPHLQPDQPAVADHVGMDDSDQLTPIRRCPECVRCLGRRHPERPLPVVTRHVTRWRREVATGGQNFERWALTESPPGTHAAHAIEIAFQDLNRRAPCLGWLGRWTPRASNKP